MRFERAFLMGPVKAEKTGHQRQGTHVNRLLIESHPVGQRHHFHPLANDAQEEFHRVAYFVAGKPVEIFHQQNRTGNNFPLRDGSQKGTQRSGRGINAPKAGNAQIGQLELPVKCQAVLLRVFLRQSNLPAQRIALVLFQTRKANIRISDLHDMKEYLAVLGRSTSIC